MPSRQPKVFSPPCVIDRGAALTRLKDGNSRLLREDLAARSPVFRALPEVLGLHTSDICNLRCPMCPRSVRQGQRKLDTQALSMLCQELFPTARKAALSASAGEPLLADYEVILEAAREYDVRLDLVTNGTRLDGELYRRSRHVLDHLNLSLDSHRSDVYERLRAGGRLDRVVANLEQIRQLRAAEPDEVLLSLSFLVTRLNLPHLHEFVRFAAALGVQGVICQRLRHDVHAARELDPDGEGGLDAPARRRCFDQGRQAARETGVNLYLQDVGLPNEVVTHLRGKRPAPIEDEPCCWFVAQYLSVQPDGDLYPCCFPSTHRFGNLFDQRPAQAWNGPVAQELRRAQFAGRGSLFCRTCPQLRHLRPVRARKLAEAAKRVRMARGWIRSKRRERRRAAGRMRPPAAPRIFHVCNWNGHSGGIKVIYDHVAALRELGYDAALASYGEFRRCDWFPHDTRLTPARSGLLDELLPDDVLVLPEICMRDEELIGVPSRQWVLVQNPDLMTGDPSDPRFSGVLTPSHPLVDVIREERGFRGPLAVVSGFLEQEYLLPPRRFTRRPPRVLVIDRKGKNRGEAVCAARALERAGFAVDRVRPSCSRDEFVRLFAEHDVYLHVSYREGFPISLLEAFGAGCLVGAFGGRGGLEFLRHGENAVVVEDGDWQALVDFVCALDRVPPATHDAMLARARATAARYTRQAFVRRLGQVFAERVAGPACS